MLARIEHLPSDRDSCAANTPAMRWQPVRFSDFRRLRFAAGAATRIQPQEMQAAAQLRRPVRGLSEDFLSPFQSLVSRPWRLRRRSCALSIGPAHLEVPGAYALRFPASASHLRVGRWSSSPLGSSHPRTPAAGSRKRRCREFLSEPSRVSARPKDLRAVCVCRCCRATGQMPHRMQPRHRLCSP